MQSLYFLYLKFQASNCPLWVYSLGLAESGLVRYLKTTFLAMRLKWLLIQKGVQMCSLTTAFCVCFDVGTQECPLAEHVLAKKVCASFVALSAL